MEERRELEEFGNGREIDLKSGAKYRIDWDDHCVVVYKMDWSQHPPKIIDQLWLEPELLPKLVDYASENMKKERKLFN